MYYYTLSCPHSAILATVIMSEEQNSRLLRKISRLFLRIRKWFLNRPETVSSMNNIITQWTHFYSIFFSSNERIIFSQSMNELATSKNVKIKKKILFAKIWFWFNLRCKMQKDTYCSLHAGANFEGICSKNAFRAWILLSYKIIKITGKSCKISSCFTKKYKNFKIESSCR